MQTTATQAPAATPPGFTSAPDASAAPTAAFLQASRSGDIEAAQAILDQNPDSREALLTDLARTQTGMVYEVAGAPRTRQNPPFLAPADRDARNQISGLRDEINNAAISHKVSPEAIGAILYQEIYTKDSADKVQTEWAAKIANTPVGSPQRSQAITDANNDWNVSNPLNRNNITRDTTIGLSQLSVEGTVKLFGGQWNKDTGQYERLPASSPNSKNYLPNVMNQEQFFKDPVGNSMRLLSNPEMAPTLVGGWGERVIDMRLRNPKNEDISLLPTNAGARAQQQREDLQFRYLTGSYATGGLLNSFLGQSWGGSLGSGVDTARTQTPSRFGVGDLSPGERDALPRRDVVERLLRGETPESLLRPRR